MNSFLISMTNYLRTELASLHSANPTLYKFTDEMLNNIFYHKGSFTGDYIQVDHAGMQKVKYNYMLYGAVVRIKMTNTDNIYFYEFEYICKGVDDTIMNMYNPGDNFYCPTKVNITDIRPEERLSSAYVCELGYNIMVDITGIPGEEIELSTS
jgi:hypothetical protein